MPKHSEPGLALCHELPYASHRPVDGGAAMEQPLHRRVPQGAASAVHAAAEPMVGASEVLLARERLQRWQRAE